MKRISIIISVYNEDAVLRRFYDSFEKMSKTIQWDYELLFVNDGSTDESYEILKSLAAQNTSIKIINFSRNFGHEAAMIAGIDYATGDGMICMDADLQHPLECIPQIIEKFEEGYDIVSMIRLSNESAGLVKRVTSSGFYKVINFMAENAHFDENASDYFAITREVAEVLKNNYRDRNRFLRGYVQNVGFKKANLEYIAAERAGGGKSLQH